MATEIPIPTDPRFQDLRGQRFGRLVVAAFAGTHKKKSMWECFCDCGTSHVVRSELLRNGKTTSCGCLRREVSRERASLAKTHGQSQGSPTYRSWNSAWNRCRSPSVDGYEQYGGRGITFCKRWQKFENFLADMGERPDGTTLDRIDTNGNYEPGNCRWATAKEQNRNRRNTRFVEFRGERVCLAEAAEKAALSYNVVCMRLRKGWSVEAALSIPKRVYNNAA